MQLQCVPFPGACGEKLRIDLVSQTPSRFINESQVKLCLATKMKCLRFVKGQLNQADSWVSAWEELDPFPLALGRTSVALLGADGATPGRLCTLLLSLLSALCGRFAAAKA